jgi:hypothetical protein
VTAIVVGGAAGTLAVDVVAVQTDNRTFVYPYLSIAHRLRTTTWSATSVLVVAAVVAAVGLLVLLAGLLPGRRKLLAVTSGRATATVGVGRRSVRRTVAHAAEGVDGVSSASVELKRRSVAVTVVSPLRDPGDLPSRVQDAVSERLASLALVKPLGAAVRVRARLDENGSGQGIPAGDPGPAPALVGPHPVSVAEDTTPASPADEGADATPDVDATSRRAGAGLSATVIA